MTPLRTISVWLACALPLAAAPSAPTAGEAAKVFARIVSSYEKGEPVDAAAAKDDLLVFERKFPGVLERVSAFQKVRSPAVPVCPQIVAPAKDPNGCVMAAARAAAEDLGIAESARQESASALYLALYLGPKNRTPAERAAKAQSDPRVSQQSAARMRRVMAQGGLFTVPDDPGAAGTANPAPSAGGDPGYRGTDAAIAEFKSRPGRQLPKSFSSSGGAPPNFSAGILADGVDNIQAAEGIEDDGSANTRLVAGAMKLTGYGQVLLGKVSSKDSWTSLWKDTKDTFSFESLQYVPGATWSAGKAMLASLADEVENVGKAGATYWNKPTGSNGLALSGAVFVAGTNLIGCGVPGVVRNGAKTAARKIAAVAVKAADQPVLIKYIDDAVAAAGITPAQHAWLLKAIERGEVRSLDDARTLIFRNRESPLKGVKNNASSESAASLEAINRGKVVDFYKVTAKEEKLKLNPVDGVDYFDPRYLKKGESVIQVNKKTGDTTTLMSK